jgi:maltose O-acetyltransferase
MKIGNHTSVHWRARFFGIRNIEIGHNSIIGNDAFLDGRSGLKIGNNVALAAGVWIYTLQHDKNDSLFRSIGKKVCIEDYCWIGARVTILPGVTVGKGAVIATGAVVTKNVKPYEIIGGVPGEKIGIRSENLKYNLDFHYPFQ